ncbi:MAG: hypothetical protein V3V67_14745 [Myxococcota bacterium]
MSRFGRWGAGWLLVLLPVLLPGWACSPFALSFEEVPVETARRLLRDPRVALIDAVADEKGQPGALPGGFRWTLGERAEPAPRGLPSGAVLVIASDRRIGQRSAAALARAGNRPVYLFIPRNAQERTSLYALALQTEETIRDEDS